MPNIFAAKEPEIWGQRNVTGFRAARPLDSPAYRSRYSLPGLGTAASTPWRSVRVDCFFRVEGHVLDCATSAPLAGATISVHIDQGIHGPRTLPATFTSDAAGRFKVTTDGSETCDATATLGFRKTATRRRTYSSRGGPNRT